MFSAHSPSSPQMLSRSFQSACTPFRYALSTRTGAEAFSRALHLTTELQPHTTVLGVDGISAYNHNSRAAMFEGGAVSARSFVRMFHGVQSTHMFCDATGQGQHIIQAGGEQGDLLMPGLYAVGAHPALQAAHSQLQPGEERFAYLNDTTYVMWYPRQTAHSKRMRTWTSTWAKREKPPGLHRKQLREHPALRTAVAHTKDRQRLLL